MCTWAERVLTPEARVLSDGLTAFTGMVWASVPHEVIVCGRGCQAAQQPRLRWVNTILGNFKTALSGTQHALKFAKYAQRYLHAHAYRFNRRFDLPAMVLDLARALLTARPQAEWGLRDQLTFDANQAHRKGVGIGLGRSALPTSSAVTITALRPKPLPPLGALFITPQSMAPRAWRCHSCAI